MLCAGWSSPCEASIPGVLMISETSIGLLDITWLFELQNLNPSGKEILEPLIEFIKDHYQFGVAPDCKSFIRALVAQLERARKPSAAPAWRDIERRMRAEPSPIGDRGSQATWRTRGRGFDNC